MDYEKLKPADFFDKVKTEQDARHWLWRARSGGKEWRCPNCTHAHFYEYKQRGDIRECRLCMRRFRVRAGTIFEHSKLPLLTWFRAIQLVTQDKRGVSALALWRLLDLGSYRTAWRMLHKIRRALRERDEDYKLSGVVELDGAYFARVATEDEKGEATCLIAVESKDFIDERGRPRQRAGFAKVEVTGSESKLFAQRFVSAGIKRRSTVNTDAGNALVGLKYVRADHQVVAHDKATLDRWLPWVHRFISNAKTWLLGTHHAVRAKYLKNYLGEFTWRFNRRHDPDGLFHRALTACSLATPVRVPVLGG
jgi:transposase-like protein